MPVVMKLGESPKDPKKKPDAKAVKADPGTAKPKTKSASSDEGMGDKPKLIILGVVLVLAIGFIAWYFMGSGQPPTKETGTGVLGGTPGGVRKANGDAGTPNGGAVRRGSGLNTDEEGGSLSGKSKKIPGNGE